MINPRTLDELTRRLAETLPEGVEQVHHDLRRNLRSALGAALSRAELVSREEFDVQSALLVRTREKLEVLEARVAALERALEDERRKGA